MKRPPGHQRCCGEDPGASAPGRNFREKLSRSTKTARKTKAAHSRRRPVFAKKSPARLQETVQHLSLSSALDHVIARWRNPCHQLMGISSVSQGNVVLAPIIGWILYAPKYLLGRCRLGKSHRSPPPSSLFWRRSIGWSTTVRVWRIVYPPPTASQKISFGVRGRLSRFRSYRTVRHRHTFAV